ncbi:MAG: alpha/beta hydrolase, partial [Clostridia bacterium]|nr:alpha/beta hydrolase [Clostridia bacterium]
FVYDRSIMSSLAEMYMIMVDRDCIYEQGAEYVHNLRVRAKENLEDYEIPEAVKMDVDVYDTHEHGMQVFYVNEDKLDDTVIVYIPGGGYLNNPLKYHWNLINNVTQKTNCPVIVPIYLKVPNYTCEESYEKMIEFYKDLATRDGIEHIIFMGDSSGGGMSLALAQILRDDYPELIQPEDLFLIVPWLDVTMETEGIEEIAEIDPMLGLYGCKDIGKLWAGDKDRHDPMVSPIYGSFENLGRITLFTGTKDMLYPDVAKLDKILCEQEIEHTYVVEDNLDHPYPLFPTPEAKEAQQLMIDIINESY